MKIGSLFSGYGGLDMAVTAVLGGTTAWVSDIDKGACKTLAHRYPDVPNLGDITTVDWSSVEPVDVLCGGFPCQDVSAAGKRAGIRPGTRSGLWSQFAYAISQLRPPLVVIENVRGLLSAEASHASHDPTRVDSDLGLCSWCLADPGGSDLRALGAVLGDLADLGFDAEWVGLPASAVGAPHGRWREFVLAWPSAADHDRAGLGSLRRVNTEVRDAHGRSGADGLWPHRERAALLPTPAGYDGERGGPQNAAKRRAGGHSVSLQDAVHSLLPSAVQLLPTPRAGDGTKGGPNQRGSSGDPMLPSAVTLLPTPAVNDMGAAYTPETWDAWTTAMQAKHGNGNGHGKSLEIEAQRLLPSPRTTDVSHIHTSERARTLYGSGDSMADVIDRNQWGDYAAAVARWESATRTAPAPTEPTAKGTQRLSPRFSEWMMGVPDGWITDVPGVTRNEALKLAGNGVVPQQAEAALRWLLPLMAEAVAT